MIIVLFCYTALAFALYVGVHANKRNLALKFDSCVYSMVFSKLSLELNRPGDRQMPDYNF